MKEKIVIVSFFDKESNERHDYAVDAASEEELDEIIVGIQGMSRDEKLVSYIMENAKPSQGAG